MKEFDENITPFFAIEAEKLLSEGRISEAIELCKNGINIYPDYQTAYIVLFRAYLKNNELISAKELLTHFNNLFPTSKQFHKLKLELSQYIAQEMRNEEKVKSDLSMADSAIISDLIINTKDVEKRKFLKMFTEYQSDANYQINIKASDLSLIPGLEISMYQLNRQKVSARDYVKAEIDFSSKSDFQSIESVKVDEKSNDQIEDLQQTPLITETLAGIYESQGAIAEAIRAYEVLSLMYPERIEKYKIKIENLQKKINQ